MISSIFYAMLAVILFVLDVVKFLYKLTKISCSWLTVVTVLLIVVLSRYFRLKKPPTAIVDCILGSSLMSTDAGAVTAVNQYTDEQTTAIEWWPIANRAACLDALENSKSAIEKVRKCTFIYIWATVNGEGRAEQ